MYELLYLQNVGLLHVLARRYRGACEVDRAVDVEDLMQSGFFGLVRAERTYDPDAGKTWLAWAAWHIKREFDNALGRREGRFTRAHSGAVSLDRPMHDGEDLTIGETLPDNGALPALESVLRQEVAEAVRAAVRELPEGRAVELTKLNGLTAAQAARRLGVSAAEVDRMSRAAMKQLHSNPKLRALREERRQYN